MDKKLLTQDDIVHYVLAFISPPEMLSLVFVHSSWYKASRSDYHLSRLYCTNLSEQLAIFNGGVDANESSEGGDRVLRSSTRIQQRVLQQLTAAKRNFRAGTFASMDQCSVGCYFYGLAAHRNSLVLARKDDTNGAHYMSLFDLNTMCITQHLAKPLFGELLTDNNNNNNNSAGNSSSSSNSSGVAAQLPTEKPLKQTLTFMEFIDPNRVLAKRGFRHLGIISATDAASSAMALLSSSSNNIGSVNLDITAHVLDRHLNRLFVGFENGGITLYDIDSGLRVVSKLIGHWDRTHILKYDSSTRLLFSASHDNRIALWYMTQSSTTAQQQQQQQQHPDFEIETPALITHLAYIRRGCGVRVESETESEEERRLSFDYLVACACIDNNIYVYDTLSRQLIAQFSGHSDRITGLEFLSDMHQSSDRLSLVSCSLDSSIRVWNVTTQNDATAAAGTQSESAMAFQVNRKPINWIKIVFGKIAAASLNDKSLSLWDFSEAPTNGCALNSVATFRHFACTNFAVTMSHIIGTNGHFVVTWKLHD